MYITTNLLLSFLLALPIASIELRSGDEENFNEHLPSSRGLIDCFVWYSLQGDPSALLAKTAKPPCRVPTSFPRTLSGGWSVDTACDAAKQPNTCSLHTGAYCCYRNALKSTGPGAQACYDEFGQWISDPWLGAGTIDKETPLGSIIQQGKHVFADVLPYYSCCKTLFASQPETCNRYYEKRPPGQCEDKPVV
ncbi:unnamed protein product [Rotaria sp. Silwood2]|nr:unnamed protein product [Rotaria sp. Silwood2]CAF3022601.1 unnamed protein product [Rotaria sp. Silwood2]CAF3186726.1 unnamed protein product [Rotaria sp. Silwood2]CAF4292754.1 unnamed protein product [Rotaria sp. Silwood2]CAF4342372.1 unnamed protein product [Rotaria sp. Silwood2]